MFSHAQILLGLWSSLATFVAVMGVFCFVGWLALRKIKI
jgi:hypothetical protein